MDDSDDDHSTSGGGGGGGAGGGKNNTGGKHSGGVDIHPARQTRFEDEGLPDDYYRFDNNDDDSDFYPDAVLGLHSTTAGAASAFARQLEEYRKLQRSKSDSKVASGSGSNGSTGNNSFSSKDGGRSSSSNNDSKRPKAQNNDEETIIVIDD